MIKNYTTDSGSASAQWDNVQECQHYLDLLYPDQDALPPGYYVASWPVTGTSARMHSQWFAASARRQLVTFLVDRGAQQNVYLGLGFRSHRCTPAPYRRGASSEIVALPGVWVEVDHNQGRHAAKGLPDPQTLLAWLTRLPFGWSLSIDSTGGYHAYVLFKEPWVLDGDADRTAALHLLQRFQWTLRQWAHEVGFSIDPTADLPRVLRPPGTYNHKTGTPRRVTIVHEAPLRLDPQELLDAAWLAPAPQPARPTQAQSSGLADATAVVAGCAWLRHCRDDAANLTEPHWYSMVEILGRCQDGVRWVHEWSAPYPGYRATETDAKLRYALEKGAPRTCAFIRQHLDGDPYCGACPHWGHVKTPLALGFRVHTNGRVPGPIPETPWTYRELPAEAAVDAELAAGASLWLDEFMQFTRRWSPWAYEGFYEAEGVWVLSTVAARRIKAALGPGGVYPSLYIALVARSSIFAKTTTVRIALALLQQAGLDWLLAEDDATPQAFVRSKTLLVPPNYGDLSLDEQEIVRKQLAFTAQRGWFYEEWGQHLEAMMRRDGVMSGFRGMLRRLDDHPTLYRYTTISRGLERLFKPYLALLATATPADLYPLCPGALTAVARWLYCPPGVCGAGPGYPG